MPVVDAIRRLVTSTGAQAKEVITAVPGPTVIVKKVILQTQPGANVDAAVLAEASHLIPDSLDNVNLDYQVIDWIEAGNKMEVLVVAVKKDIINSYTETIRGAGLDPVVVDVDYFALENMFELNYDPPAEGRPVALVNIGARYSSINILKDGRSTFTGDVPVGGAEFTDALVRQLGVSPEEAEQLKLGKPAGRMRSGHGRADHRLGDRVHRRGDPARAQLLLDGRHRRAARRGPPVGWDRPHAGTHQHAQAAARLSGRDRGALPQGRRRRPGRPLADRRVRPVAGGGDRTGDAPSGGQMIRINLLPVEEAQAAAGRRNELFRTAFVALSFALIMTVAHVAQWVSLTRASGEVERLTKELLSIQGSYASVQKVEAQKRELREKLKVISELEAKRIGPVRVLEDLSAATPDKLWITEFAETGGQVKISGLGVDEQTVADFMRRLGTSPFFQGVDLEETSLVDQDGIKHKKFVLKGAVNYLGAGTAAASAKNPGAGQEAKP